MRVGSPHFCKKKKKEPTKSTTALHLVRTFKHSRGKKQNCKQKVVPLRKTPAAELISSSGSVQFRDFPPSGRWRCLFGLILEVNDDDF